MRSNYPISSRQLYDELHKIYNQQLYITGYVDSSGVSPYSGICNIMESSGVAMFSSGYIDFISYNPYFGKSIYITNKLGNL